MYRAGGVAAALALAVSGGAYAAVQATGPDARPMTESQARLQDLADNSAPDVDDSAPAPAADESPELPVEGDQSSMTTVTEDVTDAHTSTQEETDSLPQGQTQVKTAGVDGVSRVTYQVTMRDGQEVSREAVSSVVVTQRVDEVVLVGTGDATASAAPAAASSAPAAETAAAGTDAASAQAVARSMMGSYGWGDDQFSCLVSLWNRESSWDYQAENASSGAYGIPQSLPGSKMGSVGADWRTNPTTQIIWGLGYISGRYGSPCSAWAHSEATGWY